MRARLDLAMARHVHLNWELKLERAVQTGQGEVALQSDTACALGLWLHGTGMERYGGNDTMHELVRVHRQFHRDAEAVVAGLPTPGAGSGLAMAEVRARSREIVFLLTRLELTAMEESRQLSREGGEPALRSVWRRLFDGPHLATADDRRLLEVGHARLQHLRWTLAMPDAFRNWGRDALPGVAEECALGVWIRDVGLRRYHNLPAMVQLDQMHHAFHDRATTTVLALRKRRGGLADHAYRDMLDLSREIVYLLAMIEFQLLDTDVIVRRASILDDDGEVVG
ncbi:MAG: CZB domain-containing protein [Magnetococcales bacterium]|nr:CZB domain-containing protein [Magnetococcales bacterium]